MTVGSDADAADDDEEEEEEEVEVVPAASPAWNDIHPPPRAMVSP